VIPLALAGIAGGAYYFYRNGAAAPVAAAVQPSHPVMTNPEEWIDFKLKAVTPINHNTKLFTFELPNPDDTLGLIVNSCLLTKYQGPTDKKPTVRPYTPISDVDERGSFELLVKKYPNGPMSTHLHDMNVGQLLSMRGPIPKYKWEENKHEAVGLVAGGTGITPCYQLIKAIFKNPNDKTKVTLVYGNVTEEDILLKRELEELENKFPQRFRVFYLLDKPPKSWAGRTGFISEELLKVAMPKEGNVKIFVCGPPGLYKAVSGGKKSPTDQGELSGILQKLGYDKEQVYKF